MKLRLLIIKECDRRCRGCCNKDWDLSALPACRSFSEYRNIMLTGGEPMLRPDLIRKVVEKIRMTSQAPIFLYTAKVDNSDALLEILHIVDGVTVTLHTRKDAPLFRNFSEALRHSGITGKSLRLNVFHDISTENIDISGWVVKNEIRWIKNCPLPTDEVFMRLDGA